jgi:peptidoglycan-associated lipoprotein
MKNANLIGTFLLSIAMAAGVTGCKHQTMVTPIPNTGGPPSPSSAAPAPGPGIGEVPPATPPVTQESIPLDNGKYASLFSGDHNEDREKFKADIIYFDLDSSTIKASEESKLQEVAGYFKDNKKFEGLIIEGNCDERGTEKYNLSLGERRALAAREYLANLGVDPQRIKTVTYGKSHPIDPGHAEASWKQNRRDEFVLVTPK